MVKSFPINTKNSNMPETYTLVHFLLLYYVGISNFYFINAEKIRYISTEHPYVEYYNPKYLTYANLTTQRYSRANPIYYIGLHFLSVKPMHNNVSVDIYIYEYLSNVYKRSFIEMHFKLCNLVHKDKFIGAALKQGKFLKSCPYPPDDYHLYNITLDVRVIPAEFPFKKGRIIANITASETNENMASGCIDMEIKEISVKRKKGQKSLLPMLPQKKSMINVEPRRTEDVI